MILRVGLLLLKYIYHDELPQRLFEILRLLSELSQRRTGLEYLETILRYVSGSTDRVGEDALTHMVTEVIEEGEKLMPTLVDQWIERGLEQGREVGREATLHMLRQVIHRRFNVPLDHFDANLTTLDLAALTTLSDRVFEVADQAELEALLATLKTASTKDTSSK